LIRKVAKAARTEGDLEGSRLEGALAQELAAARARAAAVTARPLSAVPPEPVPGPPSNPGITAPDLRPMHFPSDPLIGADIRDAHAEHLPLVRALITERTSQIRALHPERRVEVLWVHSNDTHCVWCERRHAGVPNARARDVICVAAIDRGKITERWTFG
jgi:hypothetical protein